MYVSALEREHGEEYVRPKCPESHYWFAFWLKRGWRVKCTACGQTAEPGSQPSTSP